MDIIAKTTLAKDRPYKRFAQGVNFKDYIRPVPRGSGPAGAIGEFIGTDSFDRAWYERQRFEVDAGRDLEPRLYESIYTIQTNPNFPRNVSVYRLGPAGVILAAIPEGGEVKFATVGESQFSVPIIHYGVGIEYNKDLVIFNESWDLGIVERQVGIAFNALLNHIHLSPILNASYTSANQTAASSTGSTLTEKYLRTIEDAVTASRDDTTNPRRGPYAILCSTSNLFTLQRALTAVPQEGFTLQSDVINDIQSVIAYNGWTGSRGKTSVTYSGVSANKCYLIDLGLRFRHFRSYIKQDLLSTTGNPDVSRFILEQTVWDTYFGVYASPLEAVEEVTLPTS